MGIIKQPFRKYDLDGKAKYDAFTIWFNEEEREELNYCKALIQQPKDSTAIKELAHFAYLKLIGDQSTRWIIGRVLKNSNNNSKSGTAVDLPKSEESNGKSDTNLTDS